MRSGVFPADLREEKLRFSFRAKYRSELQSADGTLWFGTLGGGVRRLSANGEWTTFTTTDGLADNDVSSLLQSADGALWFGTQGGASRYQPEEK